MIYLDCPMGASGDMLVSALFDLNRNAELIYYVLDKIGVEPGSVEIKEVFKSHIRCSSVVFNIKDDIDGRDYKQIKDMIDRSGFEDDIKTSILKVYDAVFEAESSIHAQDKHSLHLHELGSMDTFAEIAAFLILKGEEELSYSVLPLSRGTVKTAHGLLPLPSPVTARLVEGMSVKFKESENELLTPTAAALIRCCAKKIALSEIIIEQTGFGAGCRSIMRTFRLKDIKHTEEILYQLEFNIDDMTSEDLSLLMEELTEYAKDAFVTPVNMKKGRSAFLITAIVSSDSLKELQDHILTSSASIGLRYWEVKRSVLKREVKYFDSSVGRCRIKIVHALDGKERIKPEFEDLKKISRARKQAIDEIRKKIIEEYYNE